VNETLAKAQNDLKDALDSWVQVDQALTRIEKAFKTWPRMSTITKKK
jgi:hypothetical protein